MKNYLIRLLPRVITVRVRKDRDDRYGAEASSVGAGAACVPKAHNLFGCGGTSRYTRTAPLGFENSIARACCPVRRSSECDHPLLLSAIALAPSEGHACAAAVRV